ncbi:MAG: hypothetical protein ILO68_00955, partial [Clostridia bacterium]|nr:hypothetical protein [Clostridia bacterium]
AWHLFYNIYDPADGQKGWYESSVRLNSKHDYRLTLDTSEEDEKATVVIYDLTAEKEADRAVFYVKKMKRDGSNTSYLMDFALDYPDNVRKDRNGKTTQDWAEITLYNTDEGLFLNNVLVTNTMILPGTSDEMVPWDGNATNNRSLWPDRTVEIFDYPCTTVYVDENEPDSSFRVDLDMNHRS